MDQPRTTPLDPDGLAAPPALDAVWPPEEALEEREDAELDGLELAPPAAERGPGRSRARAVARDFVEALVLAGLLFFGLQLVMQNTVVKGVSMEPNYVSDERVIVNKLAYRFGEPQRGEVIVFHAPGVQAEDFIKRIVGLPGETVHILEGRVHINGEVLDEPYRPIQDAHSFGPYTVPAGQYFVLGDNRPNSNDSRTWAGGGRSLERERIVGPVVLSVWPPSTWGLASADAPGPADGAGEPSGG
jgi:signal peptidase I